MKSKLKQLIKDYSTLDENDFKGEEKLIEIENEIILEMYNKNIISDEWIDDHSRHTSPEILYILLNKLEK